jgi:hypothetical protein
MRLRKFLLRAPPACSCCCCCCCWRQPPSCSSRLESLSVKTRQAVGAVKAHSSGAFNRSQRTKMSFVKFARCPISDFVNRTAFLFEN